MPTVHVFVGQCGNQLGPAFLDILAAEAHTSGDEAFQTMVSAEHFRRPLAPLALPQPRCLLLDTEPKVMQAAAATHGHSRRSAFAQSTRKHPPVMGRRDAKKAEKEVENGQEEKDESDEESAGASPTTPLYGLAIGPCVGRGEGSGNNWAYGRHHDAASRWEQLAEGLRREAEAAETGLERVHVLHSVAGGTGSGLGCLVAEVAREVLPRAALTHSLAWPFCRGEVVTQWYNLALCLSTLRDLVDGAFIAFNDLIGEALQRAQPHDSVAADPVSFAALNTRIGRLLTPLFLPSWLCAVPRPLRDVGKNRIAGKGLQLRDGDDSDVLHRLRCARYEDVLESLCLDPAMKFFTGVQAPQERIAGHPTATTWASVLSEAVRSLEGTFTCEGVFQSPCAGSASLASAPFAMASRSCLWALRGYDVRREGLRELQDLMASSLPNGFPLTTLLVSPLEGKPGASDKGAWYPRPNHEVNIYGHAPVIARFLAEALRKVEDQLRVGAFVHHYERFGVEKATIEDATMKLWDTVAAYDPSLVCS